MGDAGRSIRPPDRVTRRADAPGVGLGTAVTRADPVGVAVREADVQAADSRVPAEV